MEKKAIANIVVFWLSICTAFLFFSACCMFRGAAKINYSITTQHAVKFIGTIRTHQGNAEPHYELGCYLQERKRHKPAIEEFKAALELDPNHVKAYNGLGVSYDVLGDHGRACEYYMAALRIYGKLDYVLNNLGYSYLLQGRNDLAVENFKKALELDPGNSRYRNNLGLAYAKSGQYNAAVAEFKESGDEAKAHYNIAQLYYREGLYKDAEAHFEQASLLKAPDPEIEKSLKAAGTLAEIHTSITAEPAEPPVLQSFGGHPHSSTAGRPWLPAKAGDRAPKQFDNIKIHRPEEQSVAFSPAVARIKVRENAKAEAARVLEAEPLKYYDEAQALELVRVQSPKLEVPRKALLKIEVANGNGVRHMGRNVGNYLRDRGFIMMYLRNAPHFRHEETKVYYARGYLREAHRLSQELPGKQSLEEVTEIREGNAEISIIIGKDLVPHLDIFKKG